jgi:hypothetical protein
VVLFNALNNGASDDGRVGEAAHFGKLLGGGNAEANRDWQFRIAPESFD